MLKFIKSIHFLCIEGCCLYIVSGDKDLLSLGKVENVEIVTISEFLKVLEQEIN